MQQFGALAWRFGAADYRAATAVLATDWRALGPKAVQAQWDDELGIEMRRCNRAIDEEAVAQALLQDLSSFA